MLLCLRPPRVVAKFAMLPTICFLCVAAFASPELNGRIANSTTHQPLAGSAVTVVGLLQHAELATNDDPDEKT